MKAELDRNALKEAIWEIEFAANGLRNINGAGVVVKNLRVNKREGKVVADVELVFDSGERVERFKDCEYPLKMLLEHAREASRYVGK